MKGREAIEGRRRGRRLGPGAARSPEEARREAEILRAAGQVFAGSGYDQASMDAIAELVGVSKPLLYAHFGSKQGLYVAYVESVGSELSRRLGVGGDGGVADAALGAGAAGRPADRAGAAIAAFLAFVEQHADGWTVLFRELSAGRPRAGVVSALRAAVVDEVRRGLPGAEWGGPEAPEGVAEAIVGAGEALANWWLKHPDVPREQVAGWLAGPIAALAAPGADGAPSAGR